jgi:hypothetical protein
VTAPGYVRCPKCGKPRQIFAGSKLTAHAACSATPELMADVLALKEQFPRAPDARIAKDFGISVGILQAWYQHALRRRGEQRRADAAILRKHGWTA